MSRRVGNFVAVLIRNPRVFRAGAKRGSAVALQAQLETNVHLRAIQQREVTRESSDYRYSMGGMTPSNVDVKAQGKYLLTEPASPFRHLRPQCKSSLQFCFLYDY